MRQNVADPAAGDNVNQERLPAEGNHRIEILLELDQGALNRREVGAEERADIRAGGVDESDQNDFAARRFEGNLSACLIDQRETRRGDVGLAPADLAFLYWGYPRRLVARFDSEGMGVILVGPLKGPSDGIDSVEALEKIPDDYAGWISTNRIEVIGPALRARKQE